MSLEQKVDFAQEIIVSHLETPAVFFSGGKDSTVLLDIARGVDSSIPAVFIDHGHHFEHTLKFVDSMPGVRKFSFHRTRELDPDVCCANIKIELIRRPEGLFDNLFIGNRRDEHEARGTGYIESDKKRVRVYPILDFTESDIWQYLALHPEVQVNPLYALGYRSLGCKNCSVPYTDTERGGRGAKEEVMEKLRALGYF